MKEKDTSTKFDKTKPNLLLFLKHENQQLLLVATVACIIACFIFSSKMHFIIIGYSTFIYYRFDLMKQRITKYQLKGKKKSYLLFSKLLLDKPVSNIKYLEEFINDYRNADWEDTILIEQYHAVFEEIEVTDYPNYYSIKERKSYYNDFVKIHKKCLSLKPNPEELEGKLHELYYLFSEVDTDKSLTGIMMSINRSQDLLDSIADSSNYNKPKKSYNTTAKSLNKTDSDTTAKSFNSTGSYTEEKSIRTTARLEYVREVLGSHRYRPYCGNCNKALGVLEIVTYENSSWTCGNAPRDCIYCHAQNAIDTSNLH